MGNHKLRVVLDTNVLLVSISSKSQYHWVFEDLLNGRYELYITNDILTEYEEIITAKFNATVAQNVIRALLLFPNVHRAEVFYQWRLIMDDPDDNKFVDCAIAANADVIVTNDRHFRVLEVIEFPRVRAEEVEGFRKILQEEIS
ncbi:MAG TPA: putative toxin-antitoxin system toxin component, PIN family [Bacillota bacterium]|nr:putative toxin-antitoxin system toxin component, PIN family [Bacillota bacterium]